MDTTKDIIADIKTNEVEDRSILVELSGEFDLGDLESLRTVLDGALSSGLPLWVDLSRVPFFDVRVTRELAVQSHLHCDHLKLRILLGRSRPASGPAVSGAGSAPTSIGRISVPRKLKTNPRGSLTATSRWQYESRRCKPQEQTRKS
jgi:hypothetical protein